MKMISLFSHAHVVSNLYVDVLMLFKLLNKILLLLSAIGVVLSATLNTFYHVYILYVVFLMQSQC